MQNTPSIFKRIAQSIWSLFLNGLFTLLPLAFTITLFNFTFRIILRWLTPLHDYVKPTVLGKIPYSEILLLFLFILFIGFILKFFILQRIIHLIERLIFKIPLVRPVYSGMKQLVQAFSIQEKHTFKQVVMVEFPRLDMYSIGFLTSEISSAVAPHEHERYFSIFIPTTPNPTTGFFIIVSEKHIRNTNLSRQEAMTMIISGGIIQPDRFIKHV
jgi:uncharacterized membrane protein